LRFTRLRLSGFKSFVEPTELFIEPGLTAIVGPNGCGKSNLFDALRWVMGETRPTSIRGSEMDDVIFGGSAARPARNTAEVILYIDNSDRTASAPYNDYDAIEVSRRIEREAGSVYRMNGRDVRQRDVQIFFADAASGATSTAFVRQGQIALLISQKPLARRAILEEAAGIAGLHQRRHEAELRLRAAETNMARLDDVIREIETAFQSLKRQARQASRYRNLSGLIRKAEALALYLRWSSGQAQVQAAEEALAKANGAVADCTERAAIASTAQAEAAAELPPLRQREAERAAALHRLIMEREALDAEENRAREEAQRLRQRISQTEQDLTREQALDADASAALKTLRTETAELEAAVAGAETELAAAQSSAADLADALAEHERTLDRLNSELAEWHAQKQGHERTREVAEALAETSEQQLKAAESHKAAALAEAAGSADVAAVEATAAEASREANLLHIRHAEARLALDAAERAEAEARSPLENAERDVQRLSAEARALAELLADRSSDLWPPLIDAVKVEAGFEAAFAAAMGDDIDAPADEAAPHHWRDLGVLDLAMPLPTTAQALSHFVDAPAALIRRLSMTGIVGESEGASLQKLLSPGQRLVSRRGDLWRWDGYVASADAPSAAAMRLSQRNRLALLEQDLAQAKDSCALLSARHSSARQHLANARQAMADAETAQQRAGQALLQAQTETANIARAVAERASQLASLEAECRRLTQTRDAARESARQASEALAALGDGIALANATAEARAAAAQARSADSTARAKVAGLSREAEARAQRLTAVATERARWELRRTSASEQMAEHLRRQDRLREELAGVEAVPAQIAVKRNALLDTIGTAETQRNEAGDARAKAEARLAEADKAVKVADTILSSAREERARAQALREAALARADELRIRIRDELDCTPEALPEQADIREGQELPTVEYADAKVERLKREREQLGGVNLRAEEEAAEHEQRLQTMIADRADLDGAIQRLRRGIQSLNREGRERLVDAFDKVNRNFQTLFAKLFQGGEARLSFTESEDPLEAGLEIFARPPGKRLQSLSLLSGGEQALTALALIFAVFLVNPAPVCVLDEVDAPLDDANVERFCDLLDEMTRLTDTRFLVITHHALTMSRMHRLFGVTMAERGVSQLVSVKLAEAQQAAAAE
jgi:chromosome segregation protein